MTECQQQECYSVDRFHQHLSKMQGAYSFLQLDDNWTKHLDVRDSPLEVGLDTKVSHS